MTGNSPNRNLAEFYAAESERIRRAFEETRDGAATLQARTRLVDTVIRCLWEEKNKAAQESLGGVCVVALGGFGRQMLFPHSDVDVLFLAEGPRSEEQSRAAIAAICRSLWDLHLRLSPNTRTLDECENIQPENPEFSVALLDCRYLAGNSELYVELSGKTLPRLARRRGRGLAQHLVELTLARHARYGETIFHLEPNIKEAPGGLRDYHVAEWLARIRLLARRARSGSNTHFHAKFAEECSAAFDFLAATRCFLHFERGRDDNILTYELQAEAARRGIGTMGGNSSTPEDWMRTYFHHARAIHQLHYRMLADVAPQSASTARWRNWKSMILASRRASAHAASRHSTLSRDPEKLLRVFEEIAAGGDSLAGNFEHALEETIHSCSADSLQKADIWNCFRKILVQPHAADALRAMHRTGLLVKIVPEFSAVDSLVVRDYYHRYTVDEHSFRTIENIHLLRKEANKTQRRFAEILSELDSPEILFLSLLLHDIGKGMPGENHIQGSLKAAEALLARFELAEAERDNALYLIRHHLDMSSTLLRRDIFDTETIRAFAQGVGTPERLKMLCLFTYADIRAVNPDALTPWKAEMLWQLYVTTANHLSRSLDEARLGGADAESGVLQNLLALLPDTASRNSLAAFLEGFPRRYLAGHSSEEVLAHFRLAQRLSEEPLQIQLARKPHFYEVTLITADRPRLFATITGVLTAWGMNIVEAEAFANGAGTVLDTFHFTDLHRTLELNPSESERFKKVMGEVLTGRADLERLLRGRLRARASHTPKVRVPTRIAFDDTSSSRSTLLEIVTQDRPGLLYSISSAIAACACNIEVALIDTEGEKAIDVFYLTVGENKLNAQRQEELRRALSRAL